MGGPLGDVLEAGWWWAGVNLLRRFGFAFAAGANLVKMEIHRDRALNRHKSFWCKVVWGGLLFLFSPAARPSMLPLSMPAPRSAMATLRRVT